MSKTKKTNPGKCEYCSPESSPDLCKLATAKTIIDGKEYTACCIKCAGAEPEKKPKNPK